MNKKCEVRFWDKSCGRPSTLTVCKIYTVANSQHFADLVYINVSMNYLFINILFQIKTHTPITQNADKTKNLM